MREVAVPVRLGDLIDEKYRVEALLGKGGMGAVFRAKHEALGRGVAIKVLRPDRMDSGGMVQRFEREARAAARLKNEHVIDVLDVGRLPTGEPFIVMELLEGKDLAAYLNANGRLSVEETLEIVLQVCDAVGEAHAAGIVHRDLKPHNIFLTPRRDGRLHVTVLDFGISKVQGDVDDSLTTSQEMLGSPYYMSPEQLLSTRDAGPSADVWALGVILYQLLTARLPFMGETLAAITNGICSHSHVPIATARNDLPPWLASVIEQCLRKDPVGRLRSVDALSEALRSRGQSATMPAYTPQDGVRHVSRAAVSAVAPATIPDAMVTAEATNMVISPVAHPPPPPPPPPTAQPAPATMLLGASTNVGWGTSTSPKKSGGGSAVVAVSGVMLIALLLGGGWFVRRWTARAPATTQSPPVSVEDAPPAVSSPAPPAVSSVVVTGPSAVPSASKAAPGSAAKPPRVNRSPAKPEPPGDDLPSLRK